MKKMLILITALFVLVTANQAQTLKGFYDKYHKDTRFEYVSVGKFVLNLGLIFGNLDKNDREILSSIKHINILTSNSTTDPEFSNTVYDDFKTVINNGVFDQLVECRSQGEKVNVYFRSEKHKTSDLIVVTKEKDEMNFIWINGDLSEKILKNIKNQSDVNVNNLPISFLNNKK
jgi:hypothetical protein